MLKFLLSLFLSFIIILTGCNRGLESQLRGKWVIDGEPDVLTVEFFKGGRVVNTYGAGATLEGKWKVLSENTVAISMEPWDITGELAEGKLILRSGDKEKVYCKIK
jgi:hypothetical protein